MNAVEDDGLNAEELRRAQERAHIRRLPINFRLEMRGFITQGEQQACQQQGQSKPIAL